MSKPQSLSCKNWFPVLLVAIGLNGCVTPAPEISMPMVPDSVSDEVIVKVESRDLYQDSDVVVVKGHLIHPDSKVLIDFATNSPAAAGGWYMVEQEIEKELIRNGFIALSKDNMPLITDSSSAVKIDDKQVKLKFLKQRLAKGEIDIDSFVKEHKRLMNSENDIGSEAEGMSYFKESNLDRQVVRKLANVDYVLKISEFNTNNKTPFEINLRKYPQVKEFLNRNPQVKQEFEKSEIMQCTEYTAILNAKLIELSTGRIVWIGRQELSSQVIDENQLQISMSATKSVTNSDMVEKYVNQKNTKEERYERSDSVAKSTSLFGSGTRLIEKVKEYVPEQTKVEEGEAKPVEEEIITSMPDWEYKTQLIQPHIIKGVCEYSDNDFAAKKQIKRLTRAVTKELIKTIRFEESVSSIRP